MGTGGSRIQPVTLSHSMVVEPKPGHEPKSDAVSRPEFLGRGLRTLMSYALIRLVTTPGVAAQPLHMALDEWLRALDTRCRDLRTRVLGPTAWQTAVESL